MIQPINDHVLIKPISKVNEGPMATAEKNYDEMAIVLQSFKDLKEGSRIYFDSWRAKKFNEDTAEEFWLIEYGAIAAYE